MSALPKVLSFALLALCACSSDDDRSRYRWTHEIARDTELYRTAPDRDDRRYEDRRYDERRDDERRGDADGWLEKGTRVVMIESRRGYSRVETKRDSGWVDSDALRPLKSR